MLGAARLSRSFSKSPSSCPPCVSQAYFAAFNLNHVFVLPGGPQIPVLHPRFRCRVPAAARFCPITPGKRRVGEGNGADRASNDADVSIASPKIPYGGVFPRRPPSLHVPPWRPL